MMTADEVLKLHIGNLIVQISVLQTENEKLRDSLAAYTASTQAQSQVKKLDVPETN